MRQSGGMPGGDPDDVGTVARQELFRVLGASEYEFERRVNRFVARVSLGRTRELALLRNTGRLLELRRGTRVLCVRKVTGQTRLVLLSAEVDDGGIVLLDTATQCRAMEIAEQRRLLPWLDGWSIFRKESVVGDSRLDYEIMSGKRRGYLEVKSAALAFGRIASYPDCPSDRGVKHIRLLTRLASSGMRAVLLFIATNPLVQSFQPNWEADERIGRSLLTARAAGVEVRCIRIVLQRDGVVRLDGPELPVNLRKTR